MKLREKLAWTGLAAYLLFLAWITPKAYASEDVEGAPRGLVATGSATLLAEFTANAEQVTPSFKIPDRFLPPPPPKPKCPYKPKRPYTKQEFRCLAKKAGWKSSQIDKLTRVARCESGLRWNADENPPYIGLMQHHPKNLTPSSRLWDPVVNLRKARTMYEARGWQPWPQCGKR